MVDMKIVVPSRRRVQSCLNTVRTMPVDMVCVAEEELATYKAAFDAYPIERVKNTPIVTHPDTVIGGCTVFAWILNNIKAECIVFCDDDQTGVKCLVGRRPRKITDLDAIRQILQNSAEIAAGMGARLFTYAITANVLDFVSQDPFNFAKGGGPIKGIFGKNGDGGGLDTNIRYHGDGDHALTCLLRDRVVFKDTRFCFDGLVQVNAGGSQDLLGAQRFEQDGRYIKKKWGSPGNIYEMRDTGKSTIQGVPFVRMVTHVRRRQAIG